MKYTRLPQFNKDFDKLPRESKDRFKNLVKEVFAPACDEYVNANGKYKWPTTLRFESIGSAKGVFAITWSFKQPDGRATFSFKTVDGELHCVWRRCGRHEIYKNP